MTTSRRQIARPGTTPRRAVAVQRAGVATKQGGAGDELFAEGRTCSGMMSRIFIGPKKGIRCSRIWPA
jgi:hypothetical protein